MTTFTHLSQISDQQAHTAQAEYQAILQKYCSLSANPKDMASQDHHDELVIDGVTCSFYYQQEMMPDKFYIRAEVFDLENEDESLIIPQLLTDNLIRYHQQKPVFALSENMKRVIALINISLNKITGEVLDVIICELIEDVKQWRHKLLAMQLQDTDTTVNPNSTFNRRSTANIGR